METKFKVTVPKPCHEDWNAMTPEENGRFCSVCTKGVVDFTTKSAAEIQQYFTEHQGQKICGRFKNEQVNRLSIPIPKSVLEQKMPFHKAFLLTLFIVMGSTLFSCKNHNDDFVTGEPVVVEDTIQAKPIVGAASTTPDTIEFTDTEEQSSSLKLKYKHVPPNVDAKNVRLKTDSLDTILLGMAISEPVLDSTKSKKK